MSILAKGTMISHLSTASCLGHPQITIQLLWRREVAEVIEAFFPRIKQREMPSLTIQQLSMIVVEAAFHILIFMLSSQSHLLTLIVWEIWELTLVIHSQQRKISMLTAFSVRWQMTWSALVNMEVARREENLTQIVWDLLLKVASKRGLKGALILHSAQRKLVGCLACMRLMGWQTLCHQKIPPNCMLSQWSTLWKKVNSQMLPTWTLNLRVSRIPLSRFMSTSAQFLTLEEPPW